MLGVDASAWGTALASGATLGVVACARLRLAGKVAGVSGMLRQAMQGSLDHALCIGGLLIGGALLKGVLPEAVTPMADTVTLARIVAAAALVGAGTRVGSGCTSGHGICGLGRMSMRSFVAVCTFMATGMVVATLTKTAQAGYLASASASQLAFAPPVSEGLLKLSGAVPVSYTHLTLPTKA